MTPFIIGIGGYLIAFGLYAAVRSLWRVHGRRKAAGFVGGLLVAYGSSAFFGAAYSAGGGSLPATFEWPMGRADQLIQVSDGRRIAVHTASGRIQIYDDHWKLIHAWAVHAGGGVFQARLLPDDKLEVWTARGSRHFVFALDGTEIEQNSYYPVEQYRTLPITAGPGNVPTPIVLWPFSSPA